MFRRVLLSAEVLSITKGTTSFQDHFRPSQFAGLIGGTSALESGADRQIYQSWDANLIIQAIILHAGPLGLHEPFSPPWLRNVETFTPSHTSIKFSTMPEEGEVFSRTSRASAVITMPCVQILPPMTAIPRGKGRYNNPL